MFQEVSKGEYEADFGANVVAVRYNSKSIELTGKCIVEWCCDPIYNNCRDILLYCKGSEYFIDNHQSIQTAIELLNALIIKQFELDGTEYVKAIDEMGKNDSVAHFVSVKPDVSTD